MRLWVQVLALKRKKEGKVGRDRDRDRWIDGYGFVVKFTDTEILNTLGCIRPEAKK